MESNQAKHKKPYIKPVDYVKSLMSILENGEPIVKKKRVVLRLRKTILNNQLQEFFIEQYGEDTLSFVLETAEKFMKYQNMNEFEAKPTTHGTDKDRNAWLRWFDKTYGIDGERPMEEEWYKVMRAAAKSVNFTEVKAKSKSKSIFFLNGFSECCKVANIGSYHEPPKKKRNGNYSRGSYSQDTRKEWGSVFKPARG